MWPLVVGWDAWMPDKVCKHESGPVDAVGEVKSIDTLADGEVVSTIYGEIVRFEPERRLASRLLPLREGFGGIDAARGHMIFNVYPLPGDRTLVVYETVAEMVSTTLAQDEFTSQFAAAEEAGRAHWLGDYVPVLKRLLAEER